MPRGDDAARVLETDEPVLVEAFVAEPSIEAFDKAVLHRFSRLDELEFHAVLLSPLIESVADELRTVVADDAARIGVTNRSLPVEKTSDSMATDRGVDRYDQRFSAVIVDDIEHAQLSSISQRVGYEVHRPSDVRRDGNGGRHTSSRQPLARPLSHTQPRFPIDPVDALVIHHHSFPPQLPIQTPVAVPRVLCGKLAHPLLQRLAAVPFALVAMGCSPDAHKPAAPPFAHPMCLLQKANDVASCRRLHHFRLTTSFSARLSSVNSATMCFRRRFSSSNSRSRRACDTSMPPYFAFHR